MYHHSLLYVIVSEKNMVEEILRGVLPLEDCDYVFRTVAKPEEAKKLDGVDTAFIWDGGSLNGRPEWMPEAGRCVWIAGAGSGAPLSAEVVSSVGAVWLISGQRENDEALLRAYFGHLAERMKQRADARKQKICFETLIDSVPDISWFKDVNGAHLIVNQSFCGMVGKTKEQIYKQGHCYIWDASKEDEEVCLCSDRIIMNSRTTQSFEETIKTREDVRLLKSFKSALIDENGEIFGTCGIAHDETELHNIGKEMEIVLDSIPFAVLVEDQEGIVLNKNPHFDQYFPEYTDIVGKSSDEWKKSLSRRIILEDILKEVVVVQSDKGQRVLVFEEEPIQSVSRQVIGKLVTLMDITLERSIAEENAHKANTDYLTGLSNRRSLMRYLEKIHTRDDFTMIMIDLDNFKQVNDTYGHSAGDRALIETANLLRECFPDEFIARLGGDEFMIVESRKKPDEVKRDTKRLQDTLHEAYCRQEEFQSITASIGILSAFMIAEEDRHVSNLMNTVDELLYKAKNSGKDRYCVYGED